MPLPTATLPLRFFPDLPPPLPAAVIMLKYGELKPHHISMFLVALNAYGNTPFEGKLLKVGVRVCWVGRWRRALCVCE